MKYEEIEFLRESNNIEDVWDDVALEQAILAWEYCKDQEELSPGVILKTHKILMLHQPLMPDEKGYFRHAPVWIGGREGLHYSQIHGAIEQWCTEVKTDILGERRLWKQRHVEYEKIHPFIDGNGRTGRIFMNWQRHRMGLPILVIKEEEKREYYSWFK